MAKKKNNVSINALERYCNGDGENVLTRTIKYGCTRARGRCAQ